MIDSAISEIHALEDVRQTLIYNNSVINNKLATLPIRFSMKSK